MIKTEHNRWADFLFSHYLNRLLRKQFHSMSILGQLPEINPDRPLLLLPNHSTWWDGFFIYMLNKKILHRELYLMMLGEQLRKFSFFAKVGAYGIDPGSMASVKNSLIYTRDILNTKKGALICIFAQGILSPWFKRPLDFQRGFEKLINSNEKKINILPLGIKAVFLDEQHAHVFFRFGDCDQVDTKTFSGVKFYERKCEQLLNQILTDLQAGKKGFVFFSGAQSVNKRIEKRHIKFPASWK